MKRFLGSLVFLSLVTAALAEEKAAATSDPVSVKEAAVEKTPAAEVKPAAAEPAAVPSEAKAQTLPPAAAVAPIETKPVETKKEEVKKEAPKPAEAAVMKAVGPVAAVQDLVIFHEKEIASLNKKTERWNEKVGATMTRRDNLDKNVLAMTQKIEQLQKQDARKNKNEISRLNKEITRSQKDRKAITTELKTQSKELATELKEDSKECQSALKDAYQQAVTKLQQPQ